MRSRLEIGLSCVLSAGLALGAGSQAARAQSLNSVRIANGLSSPVFVTAPQGDDSRLFVVEQRSGTTGRIRIINIPANTLNSTPFFSVSPVATGGEQGLLGLAFHPNYLQNGYFYVYYTRSAQSGISAGSSIIARYRANAPYTTSTTADLASGVTLLEIRQPDANHNAGWMSFGPDGNLYIATGDGGCGNDSNCGGNAPTINPPGHTSGTGNAQDVTSNLLGKILRLDVDGPDNIPGNADDADPSTGTPYRAAAGNPFNGTNGDREIFAYGLRNPWRDSFDRLTGDLWIADVGQGAREEINFVPAGLGAGFNFGWRCLEGTRTTGLTGCNPNDASLWAPIMEYGHNENIAPTFIRGCSITGGYVYRGSAIPSIYGHYIFADYCSGDIWTIQRAAGGGLTNVINRTGQLTPPGGLGIQNVTSFGQDNQGELYICDQSGGEVYKIIPRACDADANADGVIDQGDIDYLVNSIGGGANPTGFNNDFNADGVTDQGDVDAIINVVAGGSCP